MLKLLVLSAIVASVWGIQEVEVIRSSSEHIGNIVLECQEEMEFGQEIIGEFMAFWNPEFVLKSPELGCALSCIIKKLEFLELGGKIKKENLDAFHKANGAGEEMSQKMLDLDQHCLDEAVKRINVEDGCTLALDIASCYRHGILQMHWAPNLTTNQTTEEMSDRFYSGVVPFRGYIRSALMTLWRVSDMGVATVCVALAVLVMGIREVKPSQEGMKEVATGFVRVVEECKQELNLSDHVLADLFRLWKMEYEDLNRNVGCIIVCMSKKLEVFDVEGRLHRGNAHQFALQHGADEEVASMLVSTLHKCEQQNEGVEDDCLRVLEVAKCFRTGTHDMSWSPKTEYMIGEILTEV